MRRLLRAIAIDIGPLRRHRDFRLLYIGQAVSFAGSMITYVAIPFEVYDLTGLDAVVGLLGLAELVPLLGTALLGGAMADAHDRRRLVLSPTRRCWLLALVLVANNSLARRSAGLAPVRRSRPAMSAAEGPQRPALEAMLPRLVPREELPAVVGARGTARHRRADRWSGARRDADRGLRARRDLRGRRGDVPRLARRAR